MVVAIRGNFLYRRNQGVEVRFRHAGDAQKSRADGLPGSEAGEARQALLLEHGFQLMRRSGQQHGHRPVGRHPLAGSGAAIVGQHLGALDHQRLALVDFRHPALHGGEAPFDRVGDFVVEHQWAA